jgi:hypothetical protein
VFKLDKPGNKKVEAKIETMTPGAWRDKWMEIRKEVYNRIRGAKYSKCQFHVCTAASNNIKCEFEPLFWKF